MADYQGRALSGVLRQLRPQLEAIESSGVPDAWLGAGAIRNRVWDQRFGVRTRATDVDDAGGARTLSSAPRLGDITVV